MILWQEQTAKQDANSQYKVSLEPLTSNFYFACIQLDSQ